MVYLYYMKKRIILRALLVILAAIGLTYFLQFRYFLNDAGKVWEFIGTHPAVFAYSCLIMSFIVLFFSGVIRKPFMGIGVAWSLITIITYIHVNKFTLRGAPLFPEDFQFAGNAASLSKFVDVWGIVRLIIAIILILAGCWLLDRRTKNLLQRPAKANSPWWQQHAILPRLAMVVLAICGFMVSTDFVRNHSGQRDEQVSWLNTQFITWNQVWNYDNNGFLLGFLYNLERYELPQPADYDETAIQNIHNEYHAEQQADTHDQLSSKDYNIIIILEESFYDPAIIKKYYDYGDVDITPELHKIVKSYPSGQMYSLDYGGGTANMEFEVLTGLSNYWADTVPYSDILPRVSAVPSMASFAKSAGYQTLVIHPFNGEMYKRSIVLPKEGFDEFITEQEMEYTEHEGNSNYINDRSAYQQTIKELKARSGKQFISLLTMQNHAPYSSNNYDHYDFKITNIENPAERTAAEVYLQTVHNSDKYLGEFIKELDSFSEPTVVLLYGDHSPGAFPAVHDHKDKAVSDLSHLTPYFIYANFDLGAKNLALPTTTPNCLTNTLLNTLNLQKPTYYYLLNTICQETPILSKTYLNGNSPAQTKALRQYELLNYDILGGKQYWLGF